MSLITEFKNLKFLLDSGISTFTQNNPNIMYTIKKKESNIGDNSQNINISEIQNLEELEKLIKNSDICSLKKNANKTVFADGNPLSKIMLIGEAPGAEEDKYGKPFVGKAGELLDKMLNSIELDRNKVYISNIIPWRPPGNRNPTDEEILQCLPFIQKHIEIINPSILILLGTIASKALLITNLGITKLRGKWHEYNNLGLSDSIPVRTLFHPAFLLRSPSYKRQTWDDLLEIKRKLKNNELY